MNENKAVQEAVYEVISGYLPKNVKITSEQHLGADLKLCSDDQSFVAMDVEKALGVRIPRTEWCKVFTVQDMINLLSRYIK
jgi:acyl carrier protein